MALAGLGKWEMVGGDCVVADALAYCNECCVSDRCRVDGCRGGSV